MIFETWLSQFHLFLCSCFSFSQAYANSFCCQNLKMVVVMDATTKEAYSSFVNGLKNLISSTDGCHRIKACLICDHLLEWNNDGHLPKIQLKVLAGLFSKAKLCKHLSAGGLILDDSVYKKLKKCYSYKGNEHKKWMLPMFLSP